MFPMMLMMLLATAEPAGETPVAEPEAPAAPAEVTVRNIEDGCSLVLGVNGQTQVTPLSPDVRVLGVAGPIKVAVPAGSRLLGLMCHRSLVVPDAEDDRVIRQLDVPLYIAGNGVTVKLQLANGAYILKGLDGTWDPADQAAIDAVLALFRTRLAARG